MPTPKQFIFLAALLPMLLVGQEPADRARLGEVGKITSHSRGLHGYIHTLYFGQGAYSTANRQAVERWMGTISGITVP